MKKVLQNLPIKKSIIAPAFGQVGTGIQYYSPFLNARDLISGGFLRILK